VAFRVGLSIVPVVYHGGGRRQDPPDQLPIFLPRCVDVRWRLKKVVNFFGEEKCTPKEKILGTPYVGMTSPRMVNPALVAIGAAPPLEAARPTSRSRLNVRGRITHQQTKFQQNQTMHSWIIDNLTLFRAIFRGGFTLMNHRFAWLELGPIQQIRGGHKAIIDA